LRVRVIAPIQDYWIEIHDFQLFLTKLAKDKFPPDWMLTYVYLFFTRRTLCGLI
jgi:hypothetical protein